MNTSSQELLLLLTSDLTLHTVDVKSGALAQIDLREIADVVGQWLPESFSSSWVDKVLKKGRGKWVERNVQGAGPGRIEVLLQGGGGRWVMSQGVLWDSQKKERT